MAKCAAARDFFADQGDLTPAYSAYGKENQRRAAEKDPSLGRFDIFQTRSSPVYQKWKRCSTLFFGQSRIDHHVSKNLQGFAKFLIPESPAMPTMWPAGIWFIAHSMAKDTGWCAARMVFQPSGSGIEHRLLSRLHQKTI